MLHAERFSRLESCRRAPPQSVSRCSGQGRTHRSSLTVSDRPERTVRIDLACLGQRSSSIRRGHAAAREEQRSNGRSVIQRDVRRDGLHVRRRELRARRPGPVDAAGIAAAAVSAQAITTHRQNIMASGDEVYRGSRRFLTWRPTFRRLVAVRRIAAVVLGLAVASSGLQPGLHVHAYTDHDHPEHHHGPAVHDHDEIEQHDEAGDVRLDECDPAQHVLTLAALCVAAPELSLFDDALKPSAIRAPRLSSLVASHLTDVRVHGPPLDARLAPRAPPVSLSA